MTTELFKTVPTLDAKNLAYIRSIHQAELQALPNDALTNVSDINALFVVTNGAGEKLAIVEGREAAIAAVQANAMQALSVH